MLPSLSGLALHDVTATGMKGHTPGPSQDTAKAGRTPAWNVFTNRVQVGVAETATNRAAVARARASNQKAVRAAARAAAAKARYVPEQAAANASDRPLSAMEARELTTLREELRMLEEEAAMARAESQRALRIALAQGKAVKADLDAVRMELVEMVKAEGIASDEAKALRVEIDAALGSLRDIETEAEELRQAVARQSRELREGADRLARAQAQLAQKGKELKDLREERGFKDAAAQDELARRQAAYDEKEVELRAALDDEKRQREAAQREAEARAEAHDEKEVELRAALDDEKRQREAAQREAEARAEALALERDRYRDGVAALDDEKRQREAAQREAEARAEALALERDERLVASMSEVQRMDKELEAYKKRQKADEARERLQTEGKRFEFEPEVQKGIASFMTPQNRLPDIDGLPDIDEEYERMQDGLREAVDEWRRRQGHVKFYDSWTLLKDLEAVAIPKAAISAFFLFGNSARFLERIDQRRSQDSAFLSEFDGPAGAHETRTLFWQEAGKKFFHDDSKTIIYTHAIFEKMVEAETSIADLPPFMSRWFMLDNGVKLGKTNLDEIPKATKNFLDNFSSTHGNHDAKVIKSLLEVCTLHVKSIANVKFRRALRLLVANWFRAIATFYRWERAQGNILWYEMVAQWPKQDFIEEQQRLFLASVANNEEYGLGYIPPHVDAGSPHDQPWPGNSLRRVEFVTALNAGHAASKNLVTAKNVWSDYLFMWGYKYA